MKFIDEISIDVIAGSGGKGCSSFRREKCIPFGGPDGGNGGRGGSIFLQASSTVNNLIELRLKKVHQAKSGLSGSSKLCHGKSGEDLTVLVPCGTRVFDVETGELIADIIKDQDTCCVAKGADGGFGNAHYKSSTNRAPRRTTPGYPGEQRSLRLELSVLADVGLLGLPNAGKSTFLRAVSKATPKVADYPFTTLKPHLGVVADDFGNSFTIADIPGLIAGAAEGAGLGIRFLKHLSRCRLLLHIVDIASDDDIVANIKTIKEELAGYSVSLSQKPCWLIFNKIDACIEMQEELNSIVTSLSIERSFIISAISGAGVSDLIAAVASEISEHHT